MTIARFRQHAKIFGIAALLCATLGVAGCKTVGELWRHEAANRLSAPANLLKRQIDAGPFSIAVYERVHQKGGPATLYFEGDGTMAHATPDYPLALHLATRDLSENVIYIARPCQYAVTDTKSLCTKEYWDNGRFSLEVMEAMNVVLEKLKNRHDFHGYHLVGYEGGGTIAALLAAKRDDILTLRTVAANLDIKAHSTTPMESSLNPRDFAPDLAGIPQHHFIGAWDKELSPSVEQSFRHAMGQTSCVRISTVDEVDHQGGWANRWPSLLTMPVDCKAP